MSEGAELTKRPAAERPWRALILPVLVVLGTGVSLWHGSGIEHQPVERAALGLMLLAGLGWTVSEALQSGRRQAAQQPAVPEEQPALPAPVAPEWVELRQALAELPRSTGLAVREALPRPEPPSGQDLAPAAEAMLAAVIELRQGLAEALEQAERGQAEALAQAERGRVEALAQAERGRAAVCGLLEALLVALSETASVAERRSQERLAALERAMVQGLAGLREALGTGTEALEEGLLGVEQTVAERVTALEQVTAEGLAGLQRSAGESLALERVTAEGLAGLQRSAGEGATTLERVIGEGLRALNAATVSVVEAVRELLGELQRPAAEAAAGVAAGLAGLRQQAEDLAREIRTGLAPLVVQVPHWLESLDAQGMVAASAALREQSDRSVEVFTSVARNLESTAGQIRELFFGAKAAADEMKRVRAGLDQVVGKMQDHDKISAQMATQLQTLGQDLAEMVDNLADMNQNLAEQIKTMGRAQNLSRADQGVLIGALDRVHRSIEKISATSKKF